jgi:hypothetical protein
LPGRRSRQAMARKEDTDERDVIAQLADIGENAVRRLVEQPRRMVVGTVNGIEQRVQDLATRLRAIDPLDRRVAALEKRLDSLEKTEKATARRASGPAKPSTARTARTAVATKPGQAEHDVGPPGPKARSKGMRRVLRASVRLPSSRTLSA